MSPPSIDLFQRTLAREFGVAARDLDAVMRDLARPLGAEEDVHYIVAADRPVAHYRVPVIEFEERWDAMREPLLWRHLDRVLNESIGARARGRIHHRIIAPNADISPDFDSFYEFQAYCDVYEDAE